MKEVIQKEYKSKADLFLLPLTGLNKTKGSENYNMRSYLFWGDYSIKDYKLIIAFDYDNKEGLIQYCREKIFPVLDKKCYLIENYDVDNKSIFILDMSEWAMDIQQFLAGKYSKFSREAKKLIEEYHNYIDKKKGTVISVIVYGALYPHTKLEYLDNMSALEYVTKELEFDESEMRRIGEVHGIYDRKHESLPIKFIDDEQYDDNI